jgi:hypothetical protein
MNIRVARQGERHRFTIGGKKRWTPSTFFPQLDSVLAHITTALGPDRLAGPFDSEEDWRARRENPQL